MNIKELFNKLFKSGTKNYGLALPTDLVSVPMRDRLDDEKIKELEEYKANYFRLLEQKKHFTSRDIEAADFNQEMLMNFELFGRLVINHDNNYNLDTMKDYEKEELWIKQKINPRKIKLYIDKMEAMFNETHLRLVALKEIYSESGKKLSKDKQNAILNEIYNLTSKYIIFKNNVYAALKEVESYKKEINNQEYKVEDEEDVYLLSQHDFKLSYFASILIPDKLNQIKKMNFDGIEKIAYLERELEIYAYNHLKINDLNQELDEIDKIEKTPENRQMLLDKINELEIKYLVLNNYGGYELDLKPLYEVKFDILTIDIVRQEKSPFKDISDRELKYYEDILLDKLTTNITGVDSLLSQRLDDDHKYLIQYFVDLLKYGGPAFDFMNYILLDSFGLALLLSAASDEQMMYFFDNYQIDFKNPKILYRFAKELPGVGIKTEDKVPLGTVCWINDIDILIQGQGSITINEDTNRIVQIYNYFANKENEKKSEYKIPDGITRIEILYDGDIVRDLILDNAKEKTLITSSSLKTLILPKVPGNLCAHKVVLNEGLERINGPALIDDTTSFLTIPSTLQDAYETVLNNALHSHDPYAWDYDTFLKEIVFTNYEDSITLHDKKQMNDIIKCLYESSMWYLWNELYYKNKFPYVKVDLVTHGIVLVSKDGHQVVISISDIVSAEFLKMMKSNKFLKGFTGTTSKDIYSYFKKNYEEKIINIIKGKISEVINNETKTTNKKK